MKNEPKTLRDYRTINSLTMEYLGELLRVHPQTYAKYERNPELLSIAQAKQIAKLYNVSVDDIFFTTEI